MFIYAEVIVGVNKYRLEKEDDIDVLAIDNTAVRTSQVRPFENLYICYYMTADNACGLRNFLQINRINKIRETRDAQKVNECLDALEQSARTGEGNLLALSIEVRNSGFMVVERGGRVFFFIINILTY
jgi:methylmalonyl-CoA mutase